MGEEVSKDFPVLSSNNRSINKGRVSRTAFTVVSAGGSSSWRSGI